MKAAVYDGDTPRAERPLTLRLKLLVNYRDYHTLTRGDGWQMRVPARVRADDHIRRKIAA
jgi:hypothetical protein